jgi:sodium-dependent dicarboxylate transporter 2/3/5
VALEDTGVIEKVATWFISRKICKGHPWIFLTLFFFSIVTLELFIDCVPITLIYLVMCDRICQMLGYEKGSKFGKTLVYAVLVLVIIPYGATPISHPGAVLMMGFLQSIDMPITAGQYMAVGVPFSYLAMVVVLLIVKFLIRPDFSKFDAYDPDEMAKDVKPLDAKGKHSVAVFLLVVLCWLSPDLFKNIAPGIAKFGSQLSFVAPPIIGVALLSIIHFDDKPVINVAKDLYRIPLPTLIFIVGIQAFANTLTNEATGVSVWLGNIFAPFAATIPASAVIWITLLMTVVMTQFLSNIVVLNLIWAAFMPVFMALNASGGNYTIAAWGVVMVLIANVAYMFPSASVCSPMCFTSGYLPVSDGAKYGLPSVVILYLVGAILCYPFASMIM